MTRAKPKFVCDCMLMRLGRWLRLLGYDTILSNILTDEELIRITSDENLTRKIELAELFYHVFQRYSLCGDVLRCKDSEHSILVKSPCREFHFRIKTVPGIITSNDYQSRKSICYIVPDESLASAKGSYSLSSKFGLDNMNMIPVSSIGMFPYLLGVLSDQGILVPCWDGKDLCTLKLLQVWMKIGEAMPNYHYDVDGGEGRILITRDVNLYRRAVKRGLDAFLLTSNLHTKQIAEITHRYNLGVSVNPALSRCPHCNGRLEKAEDVTKLADLIPTNTLKAYNDFWLCKQCKQVFWQGRMWSNIMDVAERVKGFKNELESTC